MHHSTNTAARRSPAGQGLPVRRAIVALVLGAIAGAGATEIAAQQAPTSEGSSGTGELVTTFCRLGQVTECGFEPARTECSWTFDFEVSRVGGSLKVSFGGYKCETIGKVTYYKDFRQDGATGICTTFPRTPADATRTGSHDESQC